MIAALGEGGGRKGQEGRRRSGREEAAQAWILDHGTPRNMRRVGEDVATAGASTRVAGEAANYVDHATFLLKFTVYDIDLRDRRDGTGAPGGPADDCHRHR